MRELLKRENMERIDVMVLNPAIARLSLTLPVLANARAAYLHLIGAHKRRVYERAKAADSSTNLPIVALLTCR